MFSGFRCSDVPLLKRFTIPPISAVIAQNIRNSCAWFLLKNFIFWISKISLISSGEQTNVDKLYTNMVTITSSCTGRQRDRGKQPSVPVPMRYRQNTDLLSTKIWRLYEIDNFVFWTHAIGKLTMNFPDPPQRTEEYQIQILECSHTILTAQVFRLSTVIVFSLLVHNGTDCSSVMWMRQEPVLTILFIPASRAASGRNYLFTQKKQYYSSW